jgi:FkbM family methyltransferase
MRPTIVEGFACKAARRRLMRIRSPAVGVYGQSAEFDLLSRILAQLDDRSVVDVGAERGSFSEAMLRAGAAEVHAIEPEPRNAEFLRRRFRGESRIMIHECAISTRDGEADLYLSTDQEGAPLTFAHSMTEHPNTDEVSWNERIPVTTRSLGSLAADGEIPSRIGILKVDTEGHDLDVLEGLGTVNCDVIMTEHWLDLPHSLGRCPWTIDDIVAAVSDFGLGQYACFVHWGEATLIRWNDASIPPGHAGNLVLLNDRVLPDVMPLILESASTLMQQVAELAARRLEKIDEIDLERAIQADAAAERLVDIGELERELARQTEAAVSREREIERLTPQPELPTARPGAARLRYELGRLRMLTRPRLGRLRHYQPKPLAVPARYLRAQAPLPAPKISIVTPSYQHGRFIERTIRSVLAQRYPALEYFVQDGGSQDETLEILHDYEGKLSGWASEPDSGQADAINRGFRQTNGEIMAWLNSDDLLLPGSLAYVARHFVEHPDVDVVYGHRLMIDESDGQIGAWILPKHDDIALTVADYIPQETVFWRRRIWEAAGGEIDPTFAYAMDWDLLLRFRDAGAKMERLPRFLGAFRIHDEQKTTSDYAVGVEETKRLRERVHGRDVPLDEVVAMLKPYLTRHVLIHTRQKLVERLPLRRISVSTIPFEPYPRRKALAEGRASAQVSRSLEATSRAGTSQSTDA